MKFDNKLSLKIKTIHNFPGKTLDTLKTKKKIPKAFHFIMQRLNKIKHFESNKQIMRSGGRFK